MEILYQFRMETFWAILKKIENAAIFNNWILILNNFDNARELMGLLQKCAKTYGITLTKSNVIEVKGNISNNFTDSLQKSIPNNW
jgi:hypothetical protein